MPVGYYPDYGFGQRPDGTNKGPGFAGDYSNGQMITELSLGPANALYPAVYQGIMPWEMQTLVDASQFTPRNNMPGIIMNPQVRQVFDNAYVGSLMRAMQGLPPFWQPQDGPPGINFMPYYR